MGRPQPRVLISRDDPRTLKTFEILEATAYYAVFYQGRPINLRIRLTHVDWPGPKYPRGSFSHPGHAHNLCDRLTRQFGPGFTVRRLTDGEVVREGEED